jgi:dTDP-4-amino-4,6-dideoxygalactose transaminase
MKVPLLDLKAQYLAIKPEVDKAIADVMESQHFILGPAVSACEAACAKYSNVAHGIGVSSGTDAILVCLMAENIGPGDEVITVPYTFFATVGCISRLGATPVFVDIDPVTYNMDPAQIEAKITKRTKAIMPVHLYGQVADMDPIMAIAKKHNLVVIEDAAQAIGSEYQGRRAGSIGHYGCFSFFPSKNLGGVGDGGMVVTNDAERAARITLLRAHGSKPKYYHKLVGGNFRLDAIQGAVVSAKLPHLDSWTAGRQENAARYDRLFAQSGITIASSGDSAAVKAAAELVLPKVVANRHIFNQYVIRSPQRDALRKALEAAGISTEIYYPVPMHLQECFASLGYKAGQLPESESAARETLALPIYPELTEAQARYVVETVRDFCLAARASAAPKKAANN